MTTEQELRKFNPEKLYGPSIISDIVEDPETTP
jgi:hypothetical protein